MKKKHNAAIVILAARIPLLFKVIGKLQSNWNNKYNYPIYIHTFGDLINENLKKKIKSSFKNKIYFFHVQTSLPTHFPEKEIYYNRNYLNYVSKAFPKKRVGYLHMCYFKTNITKFGFKGCINIKLKKYSKLLFYDDDNDLEKKIDFDFFDYAINYPIVTGFTIKRKGDQEHKDITQKLWSFYSDYIKNNNIKPVNKILSSAIYNDNENAIYDLEYSCGTFEIYNLKLINNVHWKKYLDSVNLFGGNYKYRWGDMQVSNLYMRTFFKNPIYNLNLIKKKILNNKIKGSNEFIYFGSLDKYNSRLFKYLLKLKKIIFP